MFRKKEIIHLELNPGPISDDDQYDEEDENTMDVDHDDAASIDERNGEINGGDTLGLSPSENGVHTFEKQHYNHLSEEDHVQDDEEEDDIEDIKTESIDGDNDTPDLSHDINEVEEEDNEAQDVISLTESEGNQDEDDYDYSDKDCKDCVIPGLVSIEVLIERCKELGLTADLEYKGPKIKNRAKKKKVKKQGVGEYEVEAIVDHREDENGVTLYYVKWKDWDDEYNTWEPKEHLKGCNDKLYKYLKEVEKYEEGLNKNPVLNAHQKLIHLGTRLIRLTNRANTDPTVLLKLNNVKLSEYKFTRKHFTDMQKVVKDKTRALDSILGDSVMDKPNSFYSRTLKMLLSKLNIETAFGSFDQFLEFCDDRKDNIKELKAWEKSINEIIEINKEGSPIVVENLADNEGPPAFKYITSSTSEIALPNLDTIIGCECEDKNCYDSKGAMNCCPHNMMADFAYNKERTLRLGPHKPIYECNAKCKCSSECSNRVIQNGRQFKLAIFRTDNGCGWGVKALEKIPRGKFVMEYVGEIVTVEEADRRGKLYDAEGRTYLFDLDFASNDEYLYVIDAATQGNISHFVNHSCDPNLECYVAWIEHLEQNLPRICFFSRRGIKAGEQLTFDYRMQCPKYLRGNESILEAESSQPMDDQETNDEPKVIVQRNPDLSPDDNMLNLEKDEENEFFLDDKSTMNENLKSSTLIETNGEGSISSVKEDEIMATEDDQAKHISTPTKDISSSPLKDASSSPLSSPLKGGHLYSRIPCKCGSINCRKYLY